MKLFIFLVYLFIYFVSSINKKDKIHVYGLCEIIYHKLQWMAWRKYEQEEGIEDQKTFYVSGCIFVDGVHNL